MLRPEHSSLVASLPFGFLTGTTLVAFRESGFVTRSRFAVLSIYAKIAPFRSFGLSSRVLTSSVRFLWRDWSTMRLSRPHDLVSNHGRSTLKGSTALTTGDVEGYKGMAKKKKKKSTRRLDIFIVSKEISTCS